MGVVQRPPVWYNKSQDIFGVDADE